MRLNIVILIFLLSCKGLFADTLLFDAYMKMVQEHHPLIVNTTLSVEQAKGLLLEQRGAFDPKLVGGLDQKYFKDKTYFSHLNAGVKIPTWFGVDLLTGYENNRGLFLNDEQNVPMQGLWFAGFSAQIGNGLFYDKRRASLQKAKFQVKAEAINQEFEKRALLILAAKAYFDWAYAQQVTTLYERSYNNAQQRKQMVVQEAALGNKPLIDTTEAEVQVQQNLLNLQQALLMLNTARLELNNHLWIEGAIPLELDTTTSAMALEDILPLPYFNEIEQDLILQSDQHPLVQVYTLKNKALNTQRRLALESFKPTIDVKYNLLDQAGADYRPDLNFDLNDYKWSVGVGMPLFYRKQVGSLRVAKRALEINENQKVSKQQELAQKLKAMRFKIENYSNQYNTSKMAAENLDKMYKAERQLFDIGESSIFMINSRENKFFKGSIKALEKGKKLLEAKQNLILFSAYSGYE